MHQRVQPRGAARLQSLVKLRDIHGADHAVWLAEVTPLHQQSVGNLVNNILNHGCVLLQLRDRVGETALCHLQVRDVLRDSLRCPVQGVEPDLDGSVQRVDVRLEKLLLDGLQAGQSLVILV